MKDQFNYIEACNTWNKKIFIGWITKLSPAGVTLLLPLMILSGVLYLLVNILIYIGSVLYYLCIVTPVFLIKIPFLVISSKWKEGKMQNLDFCIKEIENWLKKTKGKDFMSLNYYIRKYDKRLFLISFDFESYYLTGLGYEGASDSLELLFTRLQQLNRFPVYKYMAVTHKVKSVNISISEKIEPDQICFSFIQEEGNYFIGYYTHKKLATGNDSIRLIVLNHISEELLIRKTIYLKEHKASEYPYTLATIDQLEKVIQNI
jgi:hypothetical protein